MSNNQNIPPKSRGQRKKRQRKRHQNLIILCQSWPSTTILLFPSIVGRSCVISQKIMTNISANCLIFCFCCECKDNASYLSPMVSVVRWSIIAQQLPGRTDNDVKNHWNTKLRKKLSEIGIDPVTHKPFSQILADYGNIGGLRKPGTRIGSLNKDLRNAAMLKSEQSPSSSLGFPSIVSQVMLSTISSQNERTQDTFLRNNHNGNHSLDLLAELQAIKLVTETSNCIKKETIPLPIFVEDSLSSSSSSSLTCSTAAKEKSPPDLSWHDFLLDDAFVPADPQEQDIMAEHSSKKPASQKQDVIPQNETPCNEAAAQECAKAKGMEAAVPRNDFQPSSSSDISFLEAMLDQQYDMCLDFPNLLEEPFYY